MQPLLISAENWAAVRGLMKRMPDGLMRALAAALAFGAAVYFALVFTRTTTFVCAIWPANGVFLAALLMARAKKERRTITVLCVLSNIAANLFTSEPLLPSCGYALANATEVTIAFALLRHRNFSAISFSQLTSFFRFLLVCGVVAPCVGSALGAVAITWTYGGAYLSAYKTWFVADSLGLLIITPAIMLMIAPAPRHTIVPSVQSISFYFLALIAVSVAVFVQTKAPLLFVVTPVTFLIAFRLGPKFAALATLLLAAIALFFTLNGLGPAALVSSDDPSLKVGVIQFFCFINFFTGILIAAEVAQQNVLKKQLETVSKVAAERGRQLLAALDNMSQGVCLFDADGRIVMRNDRFLWLYQFSAEDVPAGLPATEFTRLCLLAGTAPEASGSTVPLLIAQDFDQRLANGRLIRISQRPLADGGLICTYTDITADKQAEEALVYRTLHDVLTGLPNRRLLIDRLDQAVAQARRQGSSAVMLLDIDYFKSINDTLGHAAGDEILKLVSARLQSCLRDTDTVARLGGDEFAMILFDSSTVSSCEMIAARILKAVQQPIMLGDKMLTVSMSMGIALLPGDASTSDEALHAADIALYQVKRSGRNNFAFFQRSIAEDFSHLGRTVDAVSNVGLAGTGFNSMKKLQAIAR